MGDRPRHATWKVAQNWRFGAVLTVVWLVLAWVRWSVYVDDGATVLRLVLALVSSALTVGYAVATLVLWRRARAATRVVRQSERSGRHSRAHD